ncbi:aminoglycoside phosphotransferase [Mycobacterium sp. Root135]|uniref:phosphotransferase enzyme family protein n=1 Tax=Mycobacterium sp. Root135 TaxID=1736457 RepID=UPI0006FBFE30|nr:phosphotransferase [Mycobacterium sp. Root135]KQY04439.1 aminoglycoside phosphotransferase [Mycobacterium sp. Root135]
MNDVVDFYALDDLDQAARLTLLAESAAAHWDGGFHDVRLVKYRENAVFSAQRSDGQRIAVRVHRHGYHSDAALQSELHWMRELADTAGIEVPPVIPSGTGDLVVRVTHPAVPEPRQVSVLGWLGGAPVGTSEDGLELDDSLAARLYFDAGALAGSLHNHSCTMIAPAGFTRHSWDEHGLIGDDPLWGRFWELPELLADQREVLQRARSAAHHDLAAFGRHEVNYGLIHADLVPENLLNEDGRLKIIDFDDAGYGWYLFELATALYFNVDLAAYSRIQDSLIAGYRSTRPLTPHEEALLPLFLFLRGTTYVGWVQSRPETETAKTMRPMLVERACLLAGRYLAARGSA